jgi:hypothetical protein
VLTAEKASVDRKIADLERERDELKKALEDTKAKMTAEAGPALTFRSASPETLKAAIPKFIERLSVLYPHLTKKDYLPIIIEALEYPTTYTGRMERLTLPMFYAKRVRLAFEQVLDKINSSSKGGRRRRRRRGGAGEAEEAAKRYQAAKAAADAATKALAELPKTTSPADKNVAEARAARLNRLAAVEAAKVAALIAKKPEAAAFAAERAKLKTARASATASATTEEARKRELEALALAADPKSAVLAGLNASLKEGEKPEELDGVVVPDLFSGLAVPASTEEPPKEEPAAAPGESLPIPSYEEFASLYEKAILGATVTARKAVDESFEAKKREVDMAKWLAEMKRSDPAAKKAAEALAAKFVSAIKDAEKKLKSVRALGSDSSEAGSALKAILALVGKFIPPETKDLPKDWHKDRVPRAEFSAFGAEGAKGGAWFSKSKAPISSEPPEEVKPPEIKQPWTAVTAATKTGEATKIWNELKPDALRVLDQYKSAVDAYVAAAKAEKKTASKAASKDSTAFQKTVDDMQKAVLDLEKQISAKSGPFSLAQSDMKIEKERRQGLEGEYNALQDILKRVQAFRTGETYQSFYNFPDTIAAVTTSAELETKKREFGELNTAVTEKLGALQEEANRQFVIADRLYEARFKRLPGVYNPLKVAQAKRRESGNSEASAAHAAKVATFFQKQLKELESERAVLEGKIKNYKEVISPAVGDVDSSGTAKLEAIKNEEVERQLRDINRMIAEVKSEIANGPSPGPSEPGTPRTGEGTPLPVETPVAAPAVTPPPAQTAAVTPPPAAPLVQGFGAEPMTPAQLVTEQARSGQLSKSASQRRFKIKAFGSGKKTRRKSRKGSRKSRKSTLKKRRGGK